MKLSLKEGAILQLVYNEEEVLNLNVFSLLKIIAKKTKNTVDDSALMLIESQLKSVVIDDILKSEDAVK